MTLRYGIRAADAAAHLFRVTVQVPRPDPAGQRFLLPAWIPGSYLVREFARHVIRVRALSGTKPVAVEKTDKHTWRCAPLPAGRPLTLAYEVYAADPSVRGAFLDRTRAFFNGTSVFLLPCGYRDAPCLVDLFAPEEAALGAWRVATGLSPAQGTRAGGFGTYRAANYDELIDCPVAMGSFLVERFSCCGAAHEIAVSGTVARPDLGRFAADLARVCEAHVRLFEPRRAEAPFDRYHFLVQTSEDGYGGLEHRNSTALITRRGDLPARGMGSSTDGYRRLLGLASHEYFHAWNVKRIRPAAFLRVDLERENYTSLLWVFEGFTSYYDDLALARSGLLAPAQYLDLLARTVNAVQQRAGRLRQSLAESSFDAWIKYYRPDENSPNSGVSYYQKGALVALALDLLIRRESGGRRSLDHLMRLLWHRWRDAGARYEGVAEDAIGPAIREATGVDVRIPLRDWVHGTKDPDLARLLPSVGLELVAAPALESPHDALIGIRLAAGGARIANVFDGTGARAAGLSAGDEIVSLDGLRADSPARLDALLARYLPGEQVELQVFRGDDLLRLPLQLSRRPPQQWRIVASQRPAAAALRLRRSWLGAGAMEPAAIRR